MEDEFHEFPEDVLQPTIQVDAGLSPLQAVMNWAGEGNPPPQRVAFILSIPAAAAESGLEEARNVLLPLLSQLAFDDHPDVKQATAEVLGPLGPILAAKDPEVAEKGSGDAMDLLVLAHRLLQDPERGVQEAAATSVAMFAGLLSDDHRREHLSAVIDALMANYDDEQLQECAVDLVTKVAAATGPTHPGWCEECALPRMLRLSMHRDYNIRVHSVGGLVTLAACLPPEVRTEELLAAFAELCGDPVWSVRQDCASELAAMAQQLPRHAVRDRLLPLWQALAGDASTWVQAAARRQAGPLLATIHPDDCTESLLEAFVAAAPGPATLTEACAHFLPAVLHNLGMLRWPRLREVAVVLAESEFISARVALAESMHQLAAVLGREAVARDLLPLIQKLSCDEHQAVGDALAANIRSLLAALPPCARLAQLGFLSRMHPEDGSSCGQWRLRLLIAQQLAGIAALLEQQGLAEVLLPACLRLCEDPVAIVREEAARQLGAMVAGLLPQAVGVGGGRAEEHGGEQPAGPPPADEAEQREEAVAAAAAPEQRVDAPAAAAAGVQEQQEVDKQQQTVEEQQRQQVEAQRQAEADEQAEAQQQQDEADQQSGSQQQQQQGLAGPVAVVQQIVRHMIELQRSSCHRARQTYLAFCSAMLMPPPAQRLPAQQPPAEPAAAGAAGAATPAAEQAAAAAQQPGASPSNPEPGPAPEPVAARAAPAESAEPAVPAEAAEAAESQAAPAPQAPAAAPAGGGAAPAAAAAAQAGAGAAPAALAGAGAAQAWTPLPEAVAGSSIVQGLLEAAVGLAGDPVPNVRLGVARLLSALLGQQPQLAAASARVAPALASLAADADRDVQQAAASGLQTNA